MSEQQGIRQQAIQQVSLKTLEKVGLFKRTGNIFLYKKSERIMAAIFAVSDSIMSNTLKEQIRGESLRLFTEVRDVITNRGTVSSIDGGKLALKAISLISMFEVACRLGEISENNYGILRSELTKFAEALNQFQDDDGDEIDRSIFDDGLIEKHRSSTKTSRLSDKQRNHLGSLSRRTVATTRTINTHTQGEAPKTFNDQMSDTLRINENSIKDRESNVLEIVRKNGSVSIKDVLSEMPLFGEKTIQRTLSSLVMKGSVKKSGDRRWSRYEIVNTNSPDL